MTPQKTCPLCLGLLYIIGTPGTTTYYRCSSCGADCKVRHEPGVGEYFKTTPRKDDDEETIDHPNIRTTG